MGLVVKSYMTNGQRPPHNGQLVIMHILVSRSSYMTATDPI
jgi:hypothetical protein